MSTLPSTPSLATRYGPSAEEDEAELDVEEDEAELEVEGGGGGGICLMPVWLNAVCRSIINFFIAIGGSFPVPSGVLAAALRSPKNFLITASLLGV